MSPLHGRSLKVASVWASVIAALFFALGYASTMPHVAPWPYRTAADLVVPTLVVWCVVLVIAYPLAFFRARARTGL